MSLFLVSTEVDITLELEVLHELREALNLEFKRLGPADRAVMARRLARGVEKLLPDLLGWEFEAPTSAQIAYATAICKRLRTEMPREVRARRGAMHRFLDEHSGSDRRSK